MRKIFLTTFIVILIDQTLKVWIKTNMLIGQAEPIFEWFEIFFIENKGFAFGNKLSDILPLSEETAKLTLTLFRIVVVIIGIKYLSSIVKRKFPTGALIALGLIIGGAIGNIIDSTFYGVLFSDSTKNSVAQFLPESADYSQLFLGNVVDMFYFPFFTVDLPNWLGQKLVALLEGGDGLFTFFAPVFNIADAGISVGICIILLFYRRVFS